MRLSERSSPYLQKQHVMAGPAEERSEADRELIGHGILSAIASAPSPVRPVEELHLQGVPLTPRVRAAIAAAAPGLSRLFLYCYNLSASGIEAGAPRALPSASARKAAATPTASGPGPVTSARYTAEASAVAAMVAEAMAEAPPEAALLRAVAPGLRHLAVRESPTLPGYGPAALAALRYCTLLESLDVRLASKPLGRIGWDFGHTFQLLPPLLQVCASLPGLRALGLYTYGRSPADTCDADYERLTQRFDNGSIAIAASLGQLTALTRLAVHSATRQAVLPALRSLSQLQELELPETSLTPSALKLLAGKIHLRRLVLRSIEEQEEGALVERLLLPRSLVLPTGLQSLELTCCAAPRVLLALALPPALTRLQLPGFRVGQVEFLGEGPFADSSDEDDDGDDEEEVEEDEEEAEAAAAAASLLGACEVLVGRFDGSALTRLFSLYNINLWDEGIMPGGFAALAAALARLGLRGLRIGSDVVARECFEALWNAMPGLEELELQRMRPHDITQMAPLTRLRSVALELGDVIEDKEELYAALRGFIAVAPDLRRLKLALSEPGEGAHLKEQKRALQWVAERLRRDLERPGRDPCTVCA